MTQVQPILARKPWPYVLVNEEFLEHSPPTRVRLMYGGVCPATAELRSWGRAEEPEVRGLFIEKRSCPA